MPEKTKGRGKSKETGVPGTDFIPGTESDEDFDKVLSLLSGWLSAGVVYADLDSDGDVVFELPEEMRDLFGAEIPTGLTREQVVRIIRTEIPALIGAGLAENPKQYLRFHIPERLHERLDVFMERSRRAVESLVSKELKERVLLRRTTLHHIIQEIRSVSGTYESVSGKGVKETLPFKAVEFIFARPRAAASMVLMDPQEGIVGFSPRDVMQVRVDLHKDDIKALVRDLTELIEQNST